MSPDAYAVLQAPMHFLTLLLAILQEKTTRKYSSTSGIPSSEMEEDETVLRASRESKPQRPVCQFGPPPVDKTIVMTVILSKGVSA